MAYELVISEKPKSSLRIAHALADDNPHKISIAGVPYYELTHKKKKIIVACAVGHLFGLQEKQKSNTYPVFDIEWTPNIGFARKYASILKRLSEKADSYTIACDYDVEGEVIGWNVLRFICGQKDAKRMKFSSLTKSDLKKAYKKASPNINWGQAFAGETRHLLDYYYGISLSRALMSAIKKAGMFRIMSIGRVQGPTLSLLADKEKTIKSFKPEPYWQIFLTVTNSNEIIVAFPKNLFDKKEAEKFLKFEGKEARAKTIKQEREILPPPPFDLTSLQIDAYKFLGLTPTQTLQLAQNLYLAGLISYPRTASQKLPPAIGYRIILNKLSKLYSELTKHVSRRKPIEGKQSDPAHPSIYPTGEKPKALSQAEKELYELIVRRFVACFAPNALVEDKRIEVTIHKEKFYAKGLQVRKKGWSSVYQVKFAEKELPDINGKVTIKSVDIEEKETKPPKRYTPASIITELTKRKLGTKGTRAGIVDTLYKRGYIKESSIVTTKLGLAVDEALEKNCPLILDEKLTHHFQKEMEQIKLAKAGKDGKRLETMQKKTLKQARNILQKISEQLKNKEEAIGKELLKAYDEVREEERQANIFGKCRVCGEGELRTIKSKRTGKRFVACSAYPKCKTTFPLPQSGLVKKAEQACKKCGMPSVLLIKKGKRPWQFCLAGCDA